MAKFDISVIICSTSLSDAYEVCQNIKLTSGLKCQFLIHDNTQNNTLLAQVYNQYGEVAQAQNLLFVHQDVTFSGKNWGTKILKRLKRKDTGCIGFAGSVYRPKDYYAGWPINIELSRTNYRQCEYQNLIYRSQTPPFDEVVIIDGLAMFCRKEVFQKYPFDEVTLKGFHCYDIDFSMTLFAAGYHNYVFTDEDHTVLHKSCGTYDKDWVLQTFLITRDKWNKITPLQITDGQVPECETDIHNGNMNFINNIKKFFPKHDAMIMLRQLPFYKKELESIQVPNGILNNGYRDWN